jgi:hypothetical protein
MRDMSNNVHLQPAFAPKAAVTDNTAQVSSVCTTTGFDSITLAFITGTNADADATFTLLIEDSPDNSTYTAVADAYLNGTEVLGSYDFADDGECRKIGYTGNQKYVRATITPANNTGNMFVGGMWVCGKASRAPTANPPA